MNWNSKWWLVFALKCISAGLQPCSTLLDCAYVYRLGAICLPDYLHRLIFRLAASCYLRLGNKRSHNVRYFIPLISVQCFLNIEWVSPLCWYFARLISLCRPLKEGCRGPVSSTAACYIWMLSSRRPALVYLTCSCFHRRCLTPWTLPLAEWSSRVRGQVKWN